MEEIESAGAENIQVSSLIGFCRVFHQFRAKILHPVGAALLFNSDRVFCGFSGRSEEKKFNMEVNSWFQSLIGF